MLDTVCLPLLTLDILQRGQPLQMKLGLVSGGINRRLNWRGHEGDGVFILLDKTFLLFWQTALSLQLLSEVLIISSPYP